MKKLFLSYVPILVTALLLTGHVNAQKNMSKASGTNSQSMVSETSLTGNPLEGGSPKDFNIKAIKNFNRNYKDATNVSWYKSGKLTVAYFKEDDKQTRVIYFPNGRWLHTMISYDERKLSDDIRYMVKDNYNKYAITWITEVHENDKVFYFINVEKDKDFKQLIAYEDKIWVHTQFKKQ